MKNFILATVLVASIMNSLSPADDDGNTTTEKNSTTEEDVDADCVRLFVEQETTEVPG